ncbi:FAD-dependent oxidoreductase [Pseudogemmobacter sp. W21_MBD1_M6]|uniref:FAD-dependent oxidoreductase n=1 Tax=Pseudogemmobacter sp. W21_MBD1_M6 TaxID=3240271 RepID=UPI003F97D11E
MPKSMKDGGPRSVAIIGAGIVGCGASLAPFAEGLAVVVPLCTRGIACRSGPHCGRATPYRLALFDCGFVRHPKGPAQAYFDAAARRGAIHLRQRVRGIARCGEGGVTVHAEGNTQSFDRLVIAAGAWSARLVRQLGKRVSLDTERGNHGADGRGHHSRTSHGH